MQQTLRKQTSFGKAEQHNDNSNNKDTSKDKTLIQSLRAELECDVLDGGIHLKSIVAHDRASKEVDLYSSQRLITTERAKARGTTSKRDHFL
jgi:hypothetical protein